MYQELKESEVKTISEISEQHPGRAYIILDPHEPKSHHFSLETRGTLYAIADKEGLDKLYTTARSLKRQGMRVMLDSNPLESDKLYFLV